MEGDPIRAQIRDQRAIEIDQAFSVAHEREAPEQFGAIHALGPSPQFAGIDGTIPAIRTEAPECSERLPGFFVVRREDAPSGCEDGGLARFAFGCRASVRLDHLGACRVGPLSHS